LEDLGVGGKILGSGQELVTGSYERGNEPLGAIKDRKFRNFLNDYWLFEDNASWGELRLSCPCFFVTKCHAMEAYWGS